MKIYSNSSLKLSMIVVLGLAFGSQSAPALAWGGSSSGGSGHGGGIVPGEQPKDPYEKEQYKPKKLSKAERDRYHKWFLKIPELGDKNGWDKWRAEGAKVLDALDNRGHDTDPEYERDVNFIKQVMTGNSEDGVRAWQSSGATPWSGTPDIGRAP